MVPSKSRVVPAVDSFSGVAVVYLCCEEASTGFVLFSLVDGVVDGESEEESEQFDDGLVLGCWCFMAVALLGGAESGLDDSESGFVDDISFSFVMVVWK